jgi:hypothetical protein
MQGTFIVSLPIHKYARKINYRNRIKGNAVTKKRARIKDNTIKIDRDQKEILS